MYSYLKNFKSTFSILVILCCLSLSQHTFAQERGDPVQVGTTQKIGDVMLFALPIATLGTTFMIGDEKGAWQFTKGLLLTEAITYGLKFSVNKQRPDLSNANSFPSGHTSTVFHSASFIHKRYGFKYSIPAYVIAGFTAGSRIDSNKHDVLDVLAGAVIGIGSTYLFTTEYQQEHMELTFNRLNGDYLLGLTYKF
jgi:membrane-associated phospholipid phosphatase